MDALGIILLVFGGLAAVSGYIWFLVVVHGKYPDWFIVCFFLPPLSLLVLVNHRRRTWMPLTLCYTGLVLMLASYFVLTNLATSEAPPSPEGTTANGLSMSLR